MNDAASACIPRSPSCPGTQYIHIELGGFELQQHYSHPNAAPFCSLQGKSESSLSGARVESWEQQWVFASTPGEHQVPLVNKVTPKILHLLQCKESRTDRVLVVSRRRLQDLVSPGPQ